MRIQVKRSDEAWSEPIYRLCESDGTVCVRWLPDENSHGPLDCGGFDSRTDAMAFKLGIDYERALHGLLAESVDDIDREREALDRGLSVRGRPPLDVHYSTRMGNNFTEVVMQLAD